MQKIQKGTVYQFFKKREKPSIWDHFGYFRSENNKKRHFIGLFWSLFANKVQNEIIFKKSGSIFLCNFMQKFRKFLWAVPKKNSGQTDKWIAGISQDVHIVGLKIKNEIITDCTTEMECETLFEIKSVYLACSRVLQGSTRI